MMSSKGRGVPPQSRDLGPLLEDAPGTLFKLIILIIQINFYALKSPPLLNRPPPPTPPLGVTVQASFHRILRGIRVRGDDPNAPPAIYSSVLDEGTCHLARRLLRGRISEEIVRSQSPNKVLLWAVPPPVVAHIQKPLLRLGQHPHML